MRSELERIESITETALERAALHLVNSTSKPGHSLLEQMDDLISNGAGVLYPRYLPDLDSADAFYTEHATAIWRVVLRRSVECGLGSVECRIFGEIRTQPQSPRILLLVHQRLAWFGLQGAVQDIRRRKCPSK